MAVLNVNPTRMELTNLKRKLATARRGHKLLKDKRDELMRRFMEMVRENKALRKRVEEKIAHANAHMALARSVMGDAEIEAALMIPMQEMEVDVAEKNVMSVLIPQFTATMRSSDGADIYPYGFASTPAEIDDSVKKLERLSEDLFKLARAEKTVMLLAEEIERTRRRVNALEYVMIPQLEETIKYITMKLDENERGNNTRLMKVKDMMLKEAHNYN